MNIVLQKRVGRGKGGGGVEGKKAKMVLLVCCNLNRQIAIMD